MRLAAAVRHTKCERETEGKKLHGTQQLRDFMDKSFHQDDFRAQ